MSKGLVFLNQMAGPLFRELCEELSKTYSPCVLVSGHPDSDGLRQSESLRLIKAPAYDSSGNIRRLYSWIRYFVYSTKIVLGIDDKPLLFIVSNPPILGLLGLVLNLTRGQRYVVLIYDIYPDVLVSTGVLRPGFVSAVWNSLNRLVYRRADRVFVISDDMAERLLVNGQLDQKPVVISNWADTNNIKPIPKAENWFVKRYLAPGSQVFLYSGNFGQTHDFNPVIELGKLLRDRNTYEILLIGGGSNRKRLKNNIEESQLKNVKMLPFQREEVLPYSIASGDFGLITYANGTEGLIVPSKFYYYIAAGLVPIIFARRDNSLSDLVAEYQIGVSVINGDFSDLEKLLQAIEGDLNYLMTLKDRVRTVAESQFSTRKAAEYAVALREIYPEVQIGT